VLKSTKTGYNSNGFLVKFGPTGEIVWGTYLGGSSNDASQAIAVDSSGNSYVAGYSTSTDFPATSGTCAGASEDAFVATLNATGSALLNAVCLGGSGTDAATAIALDSQLGVYVAGTTQSTDLPTTQGAFQSSLKGSPDAFAAKLTSGSLEYLTYLGGSDGNTPTSIAVDTGGNAYVAGYTSSVDFPTTAGAFDVSKTNAYYDTGFVAKVNPTATALLWSTFLGGSSNDEIYGVSVDTLGNVYVAGATSSSDFPTTPGALFSSQTGSYYNTDVFVGQFSADGSTLEYSGKIGNTGSDNGTAMARSGLGALYVTGSTNSPNYPTTVGAYETAQPTLNNSVGFVTKVDMASTTMCSVSLSASGTTIPGYGGSGSFNVTVPTGCPWEAINNYTGSITLGPVTHGTASGMVSFTVGVNNNTSSSQTLMIVIGPATYTITQSAGSCSQPVFNPDSLTFGNAGGLQNVAVTLPSSCPRVATVSSGWIQITSGNNTTGSGNVGIFAPASSFAQRSGTVTIGGQTIPVTEDGGPCTATVTGPSATLPSSGATGIFQITTSAPSCEWGAYGVPSWMQINAVSLSGQGNANLGFIVAPNPTPVAQVATLTIAGQPVTVTEAAGPFDNEPDSWVASVFAGNGQCCGSPLGDGNPATSVSLYYPRGLAWQNGNLYITDTQNARVRVVTPDGLINTFAGGGSGASGLATGVALGQVQTLAFGPSGTLYVSDYSEVWAIANGMASVFAGQGTNGSGDQLSYSDGVATDGAGNVYIADTDDQRIREVSGGVVTTIAGTGSCAFSGDNAAALSAAFCYPNGLAWTPVTSSSPTATIGAFASFLRAAPSRHWLGAVRAPLRLWAATCQPLPWPSVHRFNWPPAWTRTYTSPTPALHRPSGG
jgi:hypothetical protein